MKIKLFPKHGLTCVYLGVITLVISHFTGWNRHNLVLFSALAFIGIGIVLYIVLTKRNCKY